MDFSAAAARADVEPKTVHAIVLRRRDAGESDRRITLLTREEGKIDAVAKGARKAGSRLAGSSEPLTAATLQLAPGKKHLFVTQTQPRSSFPGLRANYDRLSYALALADLYEAIIPWHESNEEVYDLLFLSLQSLETHEKPEVAFVWSQLAFLKLSGFLPQFAHCVQTGVEVREAMPFLSPMAGGYIVAERADMLHDRFQTKAEVLYGLARTSELREPPPNLKFADDCIVALAPFWRQVADKPLPGLESCVKALRLVVHGS